VTADSAIAASPAADRPGFINGGEPIAGISKARKGGSIIATGNASIVSAGHEPA